MQRVALFFDGKNHMKDLRRTAEDRWLDHGTLAEWVVKKVEGDQLHAAYYYTGVPNPHDDNRDRHALSDLLDELERRPGFFVRRFNRRATTRECPHCKGVIAYTEEKMVDTSLVSDMIMLAVRDAFDIAVVFSGDLDIAPGLEALHGLGDLAEVLRGHEALPRVERIELHVPHARERVVIGGHGAGEHAGGGVRSAAAADSVPGLMPLLPHRERKRDEARGPGRRTAPSRLSRPPARARP